ncbi:MAG: translation initiation factor IF-2 N-terminal domain-containing protein, partial [Halanaerobiaceae bacterium]
MGKIRVYKLARNLDIQSKELLEILQDLDIDVSSHMSTIKEETAELVRDMYREEDVKKQEQEKEKIDRKEDDVSGKIESDVYDVEIPITVKELTDLIGKKSNMIIKKLMGLGLMANVNHPLDEETLIMLGEELNIEFNI